jgi:hypothetical protein
LVDLHWARWALDFGNALILARYLREVEEADPSLLKSIGRMWAAADQQSRRLILSYGGLGRPPKKRPTWPLSPVEIADLLDPPPGPPRWQLKFVEPKGSPGKPGQHWSEERIYMQIRFARARR